MQMKSRILFFSAVAALLAGCASTQLPASSQQYDAGESARIRLYGQNGKPSTMWVQTGGGGQPVEVKVGGSLGDALGSMVGAVKNESIGIAETENSRRLNARDGMLSKAFYREFVVPAGKPLQVSNAFIGLTHVQSMPFGGPQLVHRQRSCSSSKIRFIPRAGKDYEVSTYQSGNACTVIVFEIQTSAGKTALVPVTVED